MSSRFHAIPEKYTITEAITPAESTDRTNISVRAYDCNISSREACDLGPHMLGEATADHKGFCQIPTHLTNLAMLKSEALASFLIRR